jgi:hypothetical protein
MLFLFLERENNFIGNNKSSIVNDDNSITVAIEASFQPYSWVENGQYYGIHVDLANELAKRNETTAKFVIAEFEDLIIGVKNGTYDLAFGLEATEDRKKIVHFTNPYYDGMCAIYHTKEEKSTFSEYITYHVILERIVEDGTLDIILAKYNLNDKFSNTINSQQTNSMVNNPSHQVKDDETKNYEYQSTCLSVGCDNLPNRYSLYCSEHACAKSGCSSERCMLSSFCMNHKCDSIGCHNGRNDTGYYCDEHSCAESGCINEKNDSYSSIYCSYHECDDVLCINRKKGYGAYCSEHECADPYCTSQKSTLSDYCFIHDD